MSERDGACMLPLLKRKRSEHSVRRGRASRGYGDAAALVNIAALVVLALFTLIPPGVAAEGQAVPRILAFGDSLTAGYGVAPEEAFPVRLAAQLAARGIKAEVVNGGVSGETSAGGLARLDWALADHPDYVLLELGANDALRGIDPKLTYDNLDKILTRLQAGGIKVLLIGMRAPGNWGRDYSAEFDAIYPKLAEKHGIPLYPFFLDGVALDPALNQGDGLHPNALGAEAIAERIAPYVARLLDAG